MTLTTTRAHSHVTAALLSAGIVGGVQVAAVSYVLAATRTGFDIRRHANSQLVLGDWGWIQTANFLLFGVLLTACGVGVARAVQPNRAGVVAACGVAVYGLGSGVIVGFNPTVPAYGFPPGSGHGYPGYDELTSSAKIHGVAGMLGFVGMIVACFAFARYFAQNNQRRWSALSVAVGVSVLAVCGYLAANAGSASESFNFLPTWVVGTAVWLFVSATAWKLRSGVRT